jgi:hypothetical protein
MKTCSTIDQLVTTEWPVIRSGQHASAVPLYLDHHYIHIVDDAPSVLFREQSGRQKGGSPPLAQHRAQARRA